MTAETLFMLNYNQILVLTFAGLSIKQFKVYSTVVHCTQCCYCDILCYLVLYHTVSQTLTYVTTIFFI